MRESRSYGSVRGVPRRRHPYRDTGAYSLSELIKYRGFFMFHYQGEVGEQRVPIGTYKVHIV